MGDGSCSAPLLRLVSQGLLSQPPGLPRAEKRVGTCGTASGEALNRLSRHLSWAQLYWDPPQRSQVWEWGGLIASQKSSWHLKIPRKLRIKGFKHYL